jgi:hypothetical protein
LTTEVTVKLLGNGIFSWGAEERRSNRYGSFNLCSESYKGETPGKAPEFTSDLHRLVHKRVKLMVRVTETRQSGHVGDLALRIKPTTPEVGQEFILGVGILQLEPCSWDSLSSIALIPKDRRSDLWIDPRILYQIHDQTVELYGEETEEDFHEAPGIEFEEGAISLGEIGIQAKKICAISIPPKIKEMGRGMLAVTYEAPAEGTKMRKASDGRITWEP